MSDNIAGHIDFDCAAGICMEQGCRFEDDACSTLMRFSDIHVAMKWCEEQGTVTTCLDKIKQMCDAETGKDSGSAIWWDCIRDIDIVPEKIR